MRKAKEKNKPLLSLAAAGLAALLLFGIFLSAYSLPSLGFIRILSSWAVALRYCPIFLGRYIYRNPTSNVNYGLLHWLF